MNRNVYRRISDGAPATEDEALDAFGALKSGYRKWISIPLLMKDAASDVQRVTLSDSDIAYYRMIERDRNAWRNPGGTTITQQADSALPAQIGDAATEYAKMVRHDQSAWKQGAQR